MAPHKLRRLDKHAARPDRPGRNLAVVGFDDFYNQLDNGSGRKELTPAVAFAHRKIAQKILVDLPNVSPSISIGIELNILSSSPSKLLSRRL